MKSMFRFFLMIMWFHHIFSAIYSVDDMKKDSNTMNFDELVPFRGPVLKDHWVPGSKESNPRKEHNLCRELFRKSLVQVNISWPPPETPPPELKDAYFMGGRAALQKWYFAQRYNGKAEISWNKDIFKSFRAKPITCGGYNDSTCALTIEKYGHLINDKEVIVIGSEIPWAEAAMFNAGAKEVITIEYTKINSDYPHFTAYHPNEAAKKYLEKSWKPVDVAFSYSSLEHDGLGRYGDPLNPYSDLETIARIRCLLKPGGIFFLGFEVGTDAVAWNAHRIYGRYRLALVRLGWNLLDVVPNNAQVDQPPGQYSQPIMILQKPLMKKKSNII